MGHIYLKLTKNVLIVGGLWPLTCKKYRYLQSLYSTYSKCIHLAFTCFDITQYVELGLEVTEDFESVLNNLGVCLLYALTVIKTYLCKSNKMVSFLKRVKEKENAIIKRADEEAIHIYMTEAEILHKIIKSYCILGVLTVGLFFVNPQIEEYMHPEIYKANNDSLYRKRAFPFHSWFPFNKYKHYYLAYVVHVIFGSLGGTLVINTSFLVVSLVAYCVTRLKILNYYIRTFKTRSEIIAKRMALDENETIQNELRKCVREHNDIILLIEDLNNMIKYTIFLDFAIFSIQTAAMGFQVLISGFSVFQMFQMLEYFVAIVGYLFLFYWFCNEVSVESLNTSRVIWESDWHKCSKDKKQILQFMMMRSQKPLIFTMGPFGRVTNEQTIIILKTSYSFIAFMRQVYTRKNL